MSVYRPKKSPFWHYDFWCGGVRFSGSTGTASRPAAVEIEKAEKLKARRDREVERLADKAEIARVWKRFWEERGRHDSDPETTLYRMERLREGLTAILATRGRGPVIGLIDEDIVAEYVARRRGEPNAKGKLPAPATVNRELQILRRILRRAGNIWKLGNVVPTWTELMLPEADERIVTMGSEREAELLGAMREDFRAAARFLILSGLRLGNALPLKPEAVDFEQGIITLMQKSRKPGGKLFVLPITQAMRVLLANEIGRHPAAVFTYSAHSAAKGRGRGLRYPITATAFRKELKRAAKAIGWPDLRVHDLRHVAGTRTLAATGNLRAAQMQLGHSRIGTTAKYAHILIDATRAAMEAAHAPKTGTPAEPSSGLFRDSTRR